MIQLPRQLSSNRTTTSVVLCPIRFCRQTHSIPAYPELTLKSITKPADGLRNLVRRCCSKGGPEVDVAVCATLRPEPAALGEEHAAIDSRVEDGILDFEEVIMGWIVVIQGMQLPLDFDPVLFLSVGAL